MADRVANLRWANGLKLFRDSKIDVQSNRGTSEWNELVSTPRELTSHAAMYPEGFLAHTVKLVIMWRVLGVAQ